MSGRTVLGILFSLALATGAAAQTKAPPPAPPAPRGALPPELPAASRASEATALRYAELFIPLSSVDGQAAAFRRTFDEGFGAMPENLALEQRYPGVQTKAREAGLSAVTGAYRRLLPDIHRDVAAWIRIYFTEPELREVNVFMGSDVVRALQDRVAARAAEAMQDRVTAAGGALPTITGSDVGQALDPSIFAGVPEAQLRDYARFNMTPTGRKLEALSRPAMNMVAELTNTLMQAAAPDVQAAIIQAVSTHVQAAQREGG